MNPGDFVNSMRIFYTNMIARAITP
jgi:hypothetical protein